MRSLQTSPRLLNGRETRWRISLIVAVLLLGVSLAWIVTRYDSPLVPVAVLVACILAVAIVIHPQVGLLVLVMVVYTNLSGIGIHFHGMPSITKPLIALVALALLADKFVLRREPLVLDRQFALLAVWGVLAVLSLFTASHTSAVLGYLEDWIKDVIILFLIVNLATTPGRIRSVGWTLVLCGLFVASLTVYQFVTGSYASTWGGLAQVGVAHIVGSTLSYRASGSLGDPNFYAQILVPLVPLALLFTWDRRQPMWVRVLAACTLGVLLFAVLLTYSRGGFLALLLVLGWFFLSKRVRLWQALVISVLVALVWQAAPTGYTERIATLIDVIPSFTDPTTAVDRSLEGRRSENLVAWYMFLDHPLLGVGPKNYPGAYQTYSRVIGLDSRRVERAPHNLYLEVLAERGMVGMAIFGAILYSALEGLHRAGLSSGGAGPPARLAKSMEIGLAGYLFAGLFLHSAFPRYLWLLIGIAAAIRQVSLRRPTTEQDPSAPLAPARGDSR